MSGREQQAKARPWAGGLRSSGPSAAFPPRARWAPGCSSAGETFPCATDSGR